MFRILYALLFVAMLASCSKSYNVQGTTSISLLDGNQLYLKTIDNTEFKTIDSCSVLHGKFSFSGVLDTVYMASLFVGEDNMMPLVLEEGNIKISISNTNQNVSGTALNDTLYAFLDKHTRLENRMSELTHRQSQMLLEGMDEQEINEMLTAEAALIAAEEDKLVTTFIAENYNNVLGPGAFMMLTSSFQYPMLTPQIEHIMSQATDKFKNHPYVKEYYEAATANEAKLQGLDTSGNALQRDSTATTDAVGAAE